MVNLNAKLQISKTKGNKGSVNIENIGLLQNPIKLLGFSKKHKS